MVRLDDPGRAKVARFPIATLALTIERVASPPRKRDPIEQALIDASALTPRIATILATGGGGRWVARVVYIRTTTSPTTSIINTALASFFPFLKHLEFKHRILKLKLK